jgi:acyl-CoA hydrolase/L-amino acid N-acyltransferase YncA
LRSHFAVPPPAEPSLHPALQLHQHKICSALQAVEQVKPGDHIFVGTACATPRGLVHALESMKAVPADIELVHFLTDGAVPKDAQGNSISKFRHRTFFVSNDIRSGVKQGIADYVPLSLARLPHLISIGRVAIDVAFVQVSLPDSTGYCSYGVSVDVAPAAVAKARLVIAEVNPAMPRTMGEASLHVDDIDWIVPTDTPVIEYLHDALPEQVVEQIARYISGIIDDGATLQIGLGRVTNEALKHLTDRKDLGIHSDVITDAIIPLLECGALTGKRKTDQAGKIVTSFAMGSKKLYDLLDRNPMFSFQPIDRVCQHAVLSTQHKMVSVTQAFAVDLTGQVCVDQYMSELYSGLAAQAEFMRGAASSDGGKAIICLPSSDSDGAVSRIRPQLLPGEAASISRNEVHYVVTEYGIAYLFGKSLRERAIALIEVAHPNFRAELFAQAKALGQIPHYQTLKNMRAYPVQEEQTLSLKGGCSVLVRPSTSADADGIRALFHRLSERDVFTRFFRGVRSLSHADIQRLCNVNFENEIAFVAVTGDRENPVIVAQSCYFIDPSTNLAETAFMVSPEWQGCGLGTALQVRMVAHARKRGVRGFVAEVLAENENMIRLARSASGNVSSEDMGESVQITTLFD